MRLAPLAWVTGLAPLLTVHTTWLVSSLQGHVRWCFPYWVDCVSISSTGRDGASYFIFKGGMTTAAITLALFWWLSVRWLGSLGVRPGRSERMVPWLGLIGAMSLMLYTLTLGHHGDTFHLLRRIGVVCYFAFTYINLLLVSARLAQSDRFATIGRRLQHWGVVTLAVAIYSLILDAWLGSGYDRWEDTFEWLLAMMINAHALVLAWCWQRSGFRAGFHVD
jgi:hypothetical protein